MNLFDELDASGTLSLSELNDRVSEAINDRLPGTYWLRAETSDVRVNASSGHCYLEFVEKDERTEQIVARARGTIWARTFNGLKSNFEKTTGQAFVSGLKALVNVSVEFHKLYGYSLTVHEIDPSYTMGDLVRKRMEVVRRLQQEGVFDLNRELPFPLLPQRIAVITSPTAAGYEDFVDQLLHNKAGYPFYLKLFPAIMQGDKAEESVIDALDRICAYLDLFDIVVIIRGGGSASDLNCFDSYLLASHCAQFPLPILTGIGHERDDSVVDMVAHTRMKTPTAVAAFLIGRMDEQVDALYGLQHRTYTKVIGILSDAQSALKWITSRFPSLVTSKIERNRTRLLTFAKDLSVAHLFVEKQYAALMKIRQTMQYRTTKLLSDTNQELNLHEQFLKMASPEYILNKGYTLTYKAGKTVKQAAELMSGDEITTRFADGERKAMVQ
jgi:exodeoxyribonuclease VII large subunit